MFDPLTLTQGYHKLGKQFYSTVSPVPLKQPHWLSGNEALAERLGLDQAWQQNPDWLALLSGQSVPEKIEPIATVYSGHQFGAYNPQLGDGRALLLGELIDQKGQHWEMQLKGSGQTPYSRFADGRAVLRSSVREYLCSENIFGLGIPTTRALALAGSQDQVFREGIETAAVVLRLSSSFIRFGHFEYFYHTGNHEALAQLKDYVIERYYPEVLNEQQPVVAFFRELVRRTAHMVAMWQCQGWCHGVMNTDNFSILGETIDYGPFGFLDQFNPQHICNHSDEQGRYAFDQQPNIALWNLSCVGQTLTPFADLEQLQSTINEYSEHFYQTFHSLMKQKLGLPHISDDQASPIIKDWLALLTHNQLDYHWSFRRLSEASITEQRPRLRDHMINVPAFDQWWSQYCELAHSVSDVNRQTGMQQVNPWLVLRNWVAQEAIIAAEKQDFTLINKLLPALQNPFDEHPSLQQYHDLPPDWSQRLMLSCSS